MTKRQALELCIELWDWLADNPTARKSKWIGFAEWDKMESDCPCCQYVAETTKCAPIRGEMEECLHCPLHGFAWQGSCVDKDALYSRWLFCHNNPSLRTELAREIAAAARKALAALTE